ncbi:MAG: TetR/AcrR family transcriptional regulator [Anaerolineae bacterium]
MADKRAGKPAEERIDRRIRRTRRLFREALMALIEEKDYQKITIQDIADRADLNRVTFYFHFKDKDDLLIQTLQGLYDELETQHPDHAKSVMEWNLRDLHLTFQHVAQYGRLYKALLSENSSLSFLGRMMDYFAEDALHEESIRLPEGTVPPLPLPMVEHFYAGAFVGLMRWWVLHDMPYPPEEMARLCYQLETNSGLWALGLDPRDLTESTLDDRTDR